MRVTAAGHTPLARPPPPASPIMPNAHGLKWGWDVLPLAPQRPPTRTTTPAHKPHLEVQWEEQARGESEHALCELLHCGPVCRQWRGGRARQQRQGCLDLTGTRVSGDGRSHARSPGSFENRCSNHGLIPKARPPTRPPHTPEGNLAVRRPKEVVDVLGVEQERHLHTRQAQREAVTELRRGPAGSGASRSEAAPRARGCAGSDPKLLRYRYLLAALVYKRNAMSPERHGRTQKRKTGHRGRIARPTPKHSQKNGRDYYGDY